MWLMTTGLRPDRGRHLARRIERHLASSPQDCVSREEFRALADDVLGDYHGEETAERIRESVEALERPLVVLIGGGTGVGKSTVATQLAHELGITRVSSTDFIREILRLVVPETIAPELARSSFELDQSRSSNGATPHAEFERQAQQVLVGVQATIERAVREGMPLILEGVHLFPGLVDLDAASDGLVVQVVLTVEDGDDHLHRFAVRAADSDRPANRYGEEFDEIRELQAHVVATAHRAGIPVVENRQVDTTVRQVLDLILAAASARS
jgi:2-phosphoglycerate kinase